MKEMKSRSKINLREKEREVMETEKREKASSLAIEEEHQEPKIHYRGWVVMPFIIGNEVFEKLGIIGTLSNLLIYLTTVFNMKSITAAMIINIFSGTTNFGTFIAAFLCDTYFGRYKTLGFSIVCCFVGSLVIQLTASVRKLHPPPCGAAQGTICVQPTAGQIAFLLTGLGFLIIGAGGIRPCNLPFGVDQFNPKTTSGKRGIDSFFNWYFFTFTFAQMISLTVIVYIQSSVSWPIGLAIPAVLMFLGSIIYFAGTKLYVKVKASGSPLLSIVQVLVVSVKKRRLKQAKENPSNLYNYLPPKFMNSKLSYTDQFRCLDKAAMMTPEDQVNLDGSPTNPWKLCSMQQVEEVKCLCRVVPIWIAASLYYLAIIQQMTYAVFQALQTDRRLGIGTFQIPAATYVVFLMLGMTIFIPIYDRILVPILRKITKKDSGITVLQRIGTGMFISILCMLVSAIVEGQRRHIALTKPTLGLAARRGQIASMSGLWLIPQLMLAGTAEAFTAVGQMEFYYKQFPENMKSFAGSLYYCGIGVASYLSTFLISIVHDYTNHSPTGNWLPEDLNHGRLDLFYFMLAGIMLLNFGYFLLMSNWFRYKGASGGSAEVAAESEKIHI